MRQIRTDEEKIAKQIVSIVNDLTLDLDQVGFYVARLAQNFSYRRLGIVMEAADYERKSKELVNDPNTLF